MKYKKEKKLLKGKRVFLFFCLLAAILLLAGSSSYGATAVDPSAYTPSARILSLGRAFVGLADDASAVYLNPAGIAFSNTWKATSMSGKFLEDYDYISATGIYPTNLGVFGIGFDTYSIGGAPATTLDATSDPSDPTPIIDTTVNPISNFNTVMILSYGTKLDRFLPMWGVSENIGLGANVRLYSAGLAGDHITQGAASGSELDLGILYKVNPIFSIGASAQNLLPSSMGGKLTYAGGHTETYPATLKVGTALNLAGKEDALFKLGDQKIKALLDFDYSPTITNWPVIMHTGVEWGLTPMVTLRAGIDQTALGDGVGGITTASDLALGVGFNYGGFSFDYGYHQFAAVPGIDNHSFSFSYAPEVKKQEVKLGKLVTLEYPQDRSITFSSEASVKGQISDVSKVKHLTLNDQPVLVSPKGDFYITTSLKLGKNKLVVNGLDRFRFNIATEEVRLLRLSTFPDVPEGYWTREPISLISMLGVVTGYPDGTFRPEGNITRAEMAALLMRSGKPATSIYKQAPAFKDVKSSHWAAKFISDAASNGVVEGYPNKTFKPNGNITRAEGLAMIVRFAGVTQESYSYQYFMDVNENFWAAPIVAGAYNAGMLEFLKGKPFEPKQKLTRAEAVEMLSKTGYVKLLLNKDLLDWGSY